MVVENCSTVKVIKELLKHEEKIQMKNICLFFNGKRLEKDKNLAYYEIRDKSTLLLAQTQSLLVKYEDGTGTCLHVAALDTILTVKSLIAEKSGLPPEKLMFREKELEDNLILKDCQLEDQMLVTLRSRAKS